MRNYCFSIKLFSKYRTELMGGAIIGVMWGHLMNHTIQPYVFAQLARLLHTPAFLFLSGFGLYYSFSKNSSVTSFFRKRVVRLYIPFLIIATPFFLILLLLGKCDLLQFLGYITTLAFWYEGNYYAMWYIAISVLLYMIFPFLYHVLFNKYESPFCFLAIIILCMLCIYAAIQHFSPSYWKIIETGVSKTYMFPIGCYCGYLSKKGVEIPLWKLAIFILVCFGLYIKGVNVAVMRSLIGLPISCILLSVLFKNNSFELIRKVLAWFGRYSLEIYLLHVLIHFTFMDIVEIDDKWSMSLGVISAIVLCTPFSMMIKKVSPK